MIVLLLQVNEKRDEEKKGVDNTGFEGNKKSADVEKGEEKWKQNYVPYDDKEKESEQKSDNQNQCRQSDCLAQLIITKYQLSL